MVLVSSHVLEATKLLIRSDALLADAKLMNDAVEGWVNTKLPASEEWDGALI